MARKEIIALLLAGGQGSRLGVLTKNIAKPAVLYGGKYRIIDFTLSNCINSNIDTVGVLTQYQPLKLHSHIGIGKPWDLDRMNGGVTILTPYQRFEKGEWYSGTADAVLQNISYVEELSPKYVIILSGDHIYKMNYAEMLDFHKKKNADATISVIDVPYEEASRYGIMNITKNYKIYEFEEKPEKPKCTLASMGIYIFNWEVLKEYLLNDHEDPNSEHDFGKNIIPGMLKDGRDLYAYKFVGYWRDVGTIQAYYEASMNLTERIPEFNLFDPYWKIYTPNPVYPAHFIGETGKVVKSIIAEGCMIHGTISNSVIFPGVTVQEGTVIKNSIIMSDAFIGTNTVIDCCIIGEGSVIGNNIQCGVGEFAENQFNPRIYNTNITVVGSYTVIPNGTTLGRNVVIDNHIIPQDFTTNVIPSGGYLMKGGDEQ
ncbi:MAG: glucose-1-phosphate adenylyltransferase [Clostridiaceae bacterium]|jgi:glucose-1-phosphate adenylyltransferase|nr:glucose-1-phosphate adenylyltransferase [Bacillota bacterium]NLI38021.1 glucose-1-phosphate adenylyltransferase [Clostridiaceae bacterium]